MSQKIAGGSLSKEQIDLVFKIADKLPDAGLIDDKAGELVR